MHLALFHQNQQSYFNDYRAMFAKCKLRVFVLANKSMNLKEQAHNMAIMLKKFRISFQQIVLISDATRFFIKFRLFFCSIRVTLTIVSLLRRPEKHTFDKFFNMLRVASDDLVASPKNERKLDADNMNLFVSNADLNKHKDKTNFYLRISEIVQENSVQVWYPISCRKTRILNLIFITGCNDFHDSTITSQK